jgi:hypothetical protein
VGPQDRGPQVRGADCGAGGLVELLVWFVALVLVGVPVFLTLAVASLAGWDWPWRNFIWVTIGSAVAVVAVRAVLNTLIGAD